MKLFKNMRFSISRKLWLAFGSITFIVLISSSITYISLDNKSKINDEIINITNPSSTYTSELEGLIIQSQMLIKNWVFIDQQEKTPDKIKLQETINTIYPKIKTDLLSISKYWTKERNSRLNFILTSIEDTLFVKYKFITETLNNFDSYQDPMIMFEIQPMAETGGEVMIIADKIIKEISSLKSEIIELADAKSTEMQSSFSVFKSFLIIVGLVLLVLTLVISVFTIRIIVIPINKIKDVVLQMAKGILPEDKVAENNDEIGDMANAFNHHIESLKSKVDFSNLIG